VDDDFQSEFDEQLLNIEDFEHDGRVFAVARLAPHPTALSTVFETPEDGEPEVRSAAELVTDSADPFFWVEKFGAMLNDHIQEVRQRLDVIIGPDLEAEESREPIGQAFETDYPWDEQRGNPRQELERSHRPSPKQRSLQVPPSVGLQT